MNLLPGGGGFGAPGDGLIHGVAHLAKPPGGALGARWLPPAGRTGRAGVFKREFHLAGSGVLVHNGVIHFFDFILQEGE